ncbi:hypothetical protein CBL_11832 [Carabus blaptoides fortunei]
MAALTNPEAGTESAHNFTFILDRCLLVVAASLLGAGGVQYTYTLHLVLHPPAHSPTLSGISATYSCSWNVTLPCSVVGVIRVSLYSVRGHGRLAHPEVRSYAC